MVTSKHVFMFSVWVPTLAMVMALVGCAPKVIPVTSVSPQMTALSGELTIFAATSLTESFQDIRGVLESRNPALHITYNFAGTPTLRTQIEQGAKADLFASANMQQMELAAVGRIIEGPASIFAANRLVVVTPKGASQVKTLGDLASPGTKLVLALKDVPVGQYAREAIDKMGNSRAFGLDFGKRTLDNVVSEEANVRQALAKVVLGEADAAIVYITDVSPSAAGKVDQIWIPDSYNTLAAYPIAVVRSSARSHFGESFISFLMSAEGQAILRKHGFLEPSS